MSLVKPVAPGRTLAFPYLYLVTLLGFGPAGLWPADGVLSLVIMSSSHMLIHDSPDYISIQLGNYWNARFMTHGRRVQASGRAGCTSDSYKNREKKKPEREINVHRLTERLHRKRTNGWSVLQRRRDVVFARSR